MLSITFLLTGFNKSKILIKMVTLILVPSLIKTTYILKNGLTIQTCTAHQEINTLQILSKK